MDRWKNLASAVVETAVDDYRVARSKTERDEIRQCMKDSPFIEILDLDMTFDDMADIIDRQEGRL